MDDIVAFRFPTAMRVGKGARRALAEARDRMGVERPLLVTDGGLPATEAYRLVAAEMERVWPGAWAVFDKVHPNPIESDAEEGHAAYAAHRADGIVAVGGGSAIDGAKAILLKVAHPKVALSDIALADLPELIVPLVAVPTTAGTGSEVGRSTVVIIPALKRKVVFGGPALLPRLAILDPELTVGLPPGLTAATGMDAMTHAIESFVCPVYHPLCDGVALEAIHRIVKFLPRAVADGRDLEARTEMLVAASMGATAFQKDLGAAHSMAHALGTEYGAHHGLANAVCLAATIRFNGETDSHQYSRVAQAMGLTPGADPAGQVAGAVEALNRSVGITQRVRDLGVPEATLPALAAKALEDSNHLTNPRPVTESDFLRLFREVW
ncbi:MAG TPA: iron-containing alcohol dehydrogenase [Kofleriaceae bacterium]|nr:iron-containing alcohol dehydrogenase [Kofleriaceae bacterium]